MLKIYKIVNDINDDIYIGSTKQPLYKRFHDHKQNAKKYPERNLYKFINEIGDNHFRIILIEECEFINREYQNKKEQEFIELLKPVLNKKNVISKKCEHNRLEYTCKECCGNGICDHNRDKRLCKECRGSGICIHDKIKYNCKECFGNGICEHNKNKSYCKICYSVICEFCGKTYSKGTIKRHIKTQH